LTFIVSEIGINHNGSLDITKKLIDNAVSAGCDAVKFQKRTVEKVYSKNVLDSHRDSPWGTTTREQKMGLEFTLKDYQIIDKYCKTKKISWYVSCWDIDSQIKMRKFKTKYNKVASAMLVHVPKNIASAHINLSNQISSVLTLASHSWKPNDNEMQNVNFEDYDWKKWNSS